MSDSEQAQFLKDGRTLQVASIGPNGHPHLVAMWYEVIDGLLQFTTYRASQKILNLSRNPKITVMVEAGETYEELRGVVIEGKAEILDDLEGTAQVMARIGEKYGQSVGTAAPGVVPPAATKRVVVRVLPVETYSWDHRKLAPTR